MKRKMNGRFWVLGVATLLTAFGFQSCLNDDDDTYQYSFPNALVTVKEGADNTCFLQLDDSTTLLPVNLKSSPFGSKEVRALANISSADASGGAYSKAVTVNWIDSILTKPIAIDRGDKNDSIYGTDPVNLVDDWVTIAEDGYLTLRFRIGTNGSNQPHFVNLLKSQDPAKPYEVEFRHNAFGDNGGQWRDGLVAFRLDQLPDTEGKTVKLTLNWQSPEGNKSATFDYCTRKATHPDNASLTAVRSNANVK